MKRNGILGGLCLVVVIFGVGLPGPSGEASASSPKAATLAYVENTKLPITRQILKAFRSARPSRKSVTRHTDQFSGLSHRNVTRILLTLPARVLYGVGGRGLYEFAVDFRGPIKPKNAVTVGVSSTAGNGNGYGFLLGRTTKDGPQNSTPMHWLVGAYYGARSRNYDSCSIFGGPGAYHPILSQSILSAALRQAQTVIRRGQKRRPIQWQPDVVSSKKPAKTCTS